MVGLLKNRTKKYWMWTIAIVIITYGFLLTNQSIGVDDDSFRFYFDQNGVALSGRYGYLLLKKVFDTYSYFPFWRDILALILMIFGVTLFIGIFEKIKCEKMADETCIIFATIFTTYPLIGRMFVYISINIEVSLMIVLAAIAIYFSVEFMEHSKILYLLGSILPLTLGVSMIENCLNYYVTGVILVIWLSLYFETTEAYGRKEKQNKLWYIIKNLGIFALVSCISIILNTLIKNIVLKVLAIDGIVYAQKFVVWNFADIKGSIMNFMYAFYIRITDMLQNDMFFQVLVMAIILFVVMSVFVSVKKRQPLIFILSVCVIISVFIFYVITGNANMVTRTFVVYGLFIAFVFAILYEILKEIKIARVLLIIASCFLVFYQSRELQQIYSDDYVRFLKDKQMAEDINEAIEEEWGGVPSVPVVFIGDPLPYIEYPNEEDEVHMRSVFSGNEDGKSIRLHSFFDMLGYNYLTPTGEEVDINSPTTFGTDKLTLKAIEYAKYMKEWPAEGSVYSTEELIVVKLGPVQSCSFDVEEKYIENLLSENVLETTAYINIARQEGSKLYIRGYAYFDEISSKGTRISILLENEDTQIWVSTEQYFDATLANVSSYDAEYNNNGFYIYKNVPELKEGKWQIKVLLENGNYKVLNDELNVQEIQILN